MDVPLKTIAARLGHSQLSELHVHTYIVTSKKFVDFCVAQANGQGAAFFSMKSHVCSLCENSNSISRIKSFGAYCANLNKKKDDNNIIINNNNNV